MGRERERREPLNQAKKELVVIVMGSPADKEYAGQIKKTLDDFGVDCALRVGSAHKTPEQVLGFVRDYDRQKEKRVVYIAVAGRSNALGGFIDASTQNPVISAPPYSEKYGGADIFSSLRMPSGMATTVAAEAEIAALAAVKIFALNNPELQEKMSNYQQKLRDRIIQVDQELQQHGLQ